VTEMVVYYHSTPQDGIPVVIVPEMSPLVVVIVYYFHNYELLVDPVAEMTSERHPTSLENTCFSKPHMTSL